MKCPFCGDEGTKVVDSRLSREGAVVRRRRECAVCRRRFTTYEAVELPTPTVLKRDGRREPFDPQKLRQSLARAAGPGLDPAALDGLVSDIGATLPDTGEVTAEALCEVAQRRLKARSPAAWVRYVSMARGFEGLDEFAALLAEGDEERG